MKDVWVIGAAGQLGYYLTELYGERARGILREDFDVTSDSPERLLASGPSPRLIFNATAYNAVDRAETDRDACRALNVDVPRRLAAFAAEVGADFYHYSTDFVYPGHGEDAWLESDPPGPLNYYAETKLEGERAVLEANPKARIFRTSWVYGHRRANFVLAVLRRAAETGHLDVVDDQVGNPTFALGLAELSAAIAERPADEATAGVYNLSDSGSVSRLEFARAAVEIAAESDARLREVTFTPVATASLAQTARRPLNTRLDLTKITDTFGVQPRDWRENLARALRRHYAGD